MMKNLQDHPLELMSKARMADLAEQYETKPALVKRIYDHMASEVQDHDTATELAENAIWEFEDEIVDGGIDEELFFEIAIVFWP